MHSIALCAPLLASEAADAVMIPLVLLILVGSGAVKCFQIANRDTTSALCVQGLGMVLAGWAIVLLIQIGHALEIELSGAGRLGSGLGGVCVLAGGAMAVVGFFRYGNARPPYLQGRNQAITAFFLSLPLVFGLGILFRVGASADTTDTTDRPREMRQVVEEHNFVFEPPPKGWVKTESPSRNPDQVLVYRHDAPELWFMIRIEELPPGWKADPTQIRSGMATALDLVATSLEISMPTPIRHAGLDGFAIEMTARLRGSHMAFEMRVLFHDGKAYWLATSGGIANRDRVQAAAAELLPCFRLIDSGR